MGATHGAFIGEELAKLKVGRPDNSRRATRVIQCSWFRRNQNPKSKSSSLIKSELLEKAVGSLRYYRV